MSNIAFPLPSVIQQCIWYAFWGKTMATSGIEQIAQKQIKDHYNKNKIGTNPSEKGTNPSETATNLYKIEAKGLPPPPLKPPLNGSLLPGHTV